MGPRGAFPPAEEGSQATDPLQTVQARGFLTGVQRFPWERRLTRASDLRRCIDCGRRFRTEHLDVIWTRNAAGHLRMGLIVPKFQSSAVARNRLRRRLREIWRREVQRPELAWDVVIRARREAYQAGYDALRQQMLKWRDTVFQTA